MLIVLCDIYYVTCNGMCNGVFFINKDYKQVVSVFFSISVVSICLVSICLVSICLVSICLVSICHGSVFSIKISLRKFTVI